MEAGGSGTCNADPFRRSPEIEAISHGRFRWRHSPVYTTDLRSTRCSYIRRPVVRNWKPQSLTGSVASRHRGGDSNERCLAIRLRLDLRWGPFPERIRRWNSASGYDRLRNCSSCSVRRRDALGRGKSKCSRTRDRCSRAARADLGRCPRQWGCPSWVPKRRVTTLSLRRAAEIAVHRNASTSSASSATS